VLYEAPHRLQDTLEDCVEVFGAARLGAVVREITKLHETTNRGSLRELSSLAKSDTDLARGEIVLLIAGAESSASADTGADGYGGALDKALAALLKELPLKQAARLAAQITGARDNEAYKRALLLKEQLASQ
ncbi:MAG: rRNA (cytidine-2'-O-)-methyltransferase, partial [Steroidobacteraceae bacterium]